MKDNLFHLPVKIGRVELKNPFIVASGPTVKRVDQIEVAEKEGWAAVSIKQTFNPAPYIDYEPRYRWLKKEKLHTFTAEHRLDLEQGLRLVEEARKKCKDLVVMANYSYVSPDLEGWLGWNQGQVAARLQGDQSLPGQQRRNGRHGRQGRPGGEVGRRRGRRMDGGE